MLSHLPPELILQILQKLGYKSMYHLSLTCKKFLGIVNEAKVPLLLAGDNDPQKNESSQTYSDIRTILNSRVQKRKEIAQLDVQISWSWKKDILFGVVLTMIALKVFKTSFKFQSLTSVAAGLCYVFSDNPTTNHQEDSKDPREKEREQLLKELMSLPNLTVTI